MTTQKLFSGNIIFGFRNLLKGIYWKNKCSILRVLQKFFSRLCWGATKAYWLISTKKNIDTRPAFSFDGWVSHFLSVPILNKIKNLPKNVLLLHFILNYKTFRNFSYLNENSLWKIIPIIILIIINLVQLYLNVKQQLTGAIWKKVDQASILFFWNAVLRTYLQRIITICTLNQNSNQNMFDTLICFNRFFSHLLFWKVVLDKEQKLGWKNMK